MLSSDKEIEVVGQAGGGEEAIRMASELRPDVLLVDVSMPDMGGLDVLERMGAEIEIEQESGSDAPDREPVGDVTVRPSVLRATKVGGDEVPRLIDELPLVAILGSRATGRTRIRPGQAPPARRAHARSATSCTRRSSSSTRTRIGRRTSPPGSSPGAPP